MHFKRLRSAFTKKQPSQNGPPSSFVEPSNANKPSNASEPSIVNEPSNANAQSITSITTTTSKVPDHKGQSGLILLNPDYVKSSNAGSGVTYNLDIVAIHGITGDAFKSWTHANKTNWVRDFLPDTFPGARIYTFGYPADIFWSRNDGNIDSFARSLLEGLKREKRLLEHQPRRTMFICHSMGGIIVKKALTIARIDDDDYGEIRNSVSAILFIGTPHHGAGLASLLKLPMQITSNASFPIISFTGNVRRDLLKDLEKDAKTLQEISKNFRNSMKDIKIASFIEKSICPPLKKVIVDETTGTMGVPGERIVPMHGCNHATICKFDSVFSSGYINILEVLQDWAEETKENVEDLSSQDKSCLRSFAFVEMGYRRSDADKAHPDTCGWILRHRSYKAWLEEERGLLWIKGKPGAGKSTLLAFVYRKFQGTLANQSDLILEFFFHGRGTALQKTSVGMFRSLLHQLYKQDRSVRSLIRAAFGDKEIFGEAGKGWEWQLSEMQDMFFKCITAAAKFRRIIVFIDALDESGSDARDLVDYLHGLNDELNQTNRKAAICISCRHYPVTARIPGWDVVVEDNNQDDIAHYVQAKLQMNKRKEDNISANREAWIEIERQIVTRALGVFQWARLVVHMVLEDDEDGRGWNEIHRMLAKVPRELSDVYEHILNNVVKLERMQSTLHLIQWVFLAERPLNLDELAYAMTFDNVHISLSVHSYKDTMQYLEEYEGIQKLVNSLSGGLAEVKFHNDGNVVQFIHQSVSDFLLSTGLHLLVNKTAGTPHGEQSPEREVAFTNEMLGQGHDRLSRTCINYLKLALPEADWSQAVPDLGTSQFSLLFMDYAATFWIVHAKKAEQYGISQRYLPIQFDFNGSILKDWINMYKIAAKYQRNSSDYWPPIAEPPIGTTLLHLASEYNLRSTVQELLKEGVSVNVTDDNNETPLHCAARRGHEVIAEMLLDAGAERGPRNKIGRRPMDCAAANGHLNIVKVLLQSSADINDALRAAAGGGSTTIVKFLLDNGADINNAKMFSCSALQKAARMGCDDIVKLLLDNGANINQQTWEFASALQAAADGGHDSTFQLLLDHDADMTLQTGGGGNVLHDAAHSGSFSMVRELINRGADVNTQGGYYGNALQAAAYHYQSESYDKVLLLLNYGANVNACGGEYGNALQAACYREDLPVVALLLKRGANVNTDGGNFGSALQAAALSGNIDIIKLLLEHGANINAQGGLYTTALQAAAFQFKTEAVKFLVENGADVDIIGEELGTALQAAASQPGIEIVEFLVQNGADVNAQGGRYGTALHRAACELRTKTVEFLLKNGADIHIRGGYYETTLQAAASAGWGYMGYCPVTVLLGHGADVDINVQGGQYGNAIQAAVRDGDLKTICLLLRHGAIFDPQDEEFSRTLLIDGISEHEVGELLRERGFDIRPGPEQSPLVLRYEENKNDYLDKERAESLVMSLQ